MTNHQAARLISKEIQRIISAKTELKRDVEEELNLLERTLTQEEASYYLAQFESLRALATMLESQQPKTIGDKEGHAE